MALRALLYEVSTTPKPGLVDQNNCGAYNNLDFFILIDSIAALHGDFGKFARIGAHGEIIGGVDTFALVRQYSQQVEDRMLQVTRGTNPHKDATLTVGLLCSAAGVIGPKGALTAQEICHTAKSLLQCASSEPDEITGAGQQGHIVNLQDTTALYRTIKQDYTTVCATSLPVFARLMQSGHSANTAMAYTLLVLIAHWQDREIVAHHSPEVAEYAREYAARALQMGGTLTPEGLRFIHQMDADFIAKGISPRASSNLLTVTFFLYELQCLFAPEAEFPPAEVEACS